jgi:hypothetical protein
MLAVTVLLLLVVVGLALFSVSFVSMLEVCIAGFFRRSALRKATKHTPVKFLQRVTYSLTYCYGVWHGRNDAFRTWQAGIPACLSLWQLYIEVLHQACL